MTDQDVRNRHMELTMNGLITAESPPTALQSLLAALRRLPSDRGERIEEYLPFPDWEGKNARQATVEIPLMVKLLNLEKGLRILEVGCGRGVGLVRLHQLLEPRRLVGLDIDRSLLTNARERLDAHGASAELFWGDVRRMPFQDASFDLIIDFGTCFHIAHPHRALGEIARVLDRNGKFVHETRLAQVLSHPLRALGRAMPLEWFPHLRFEKWRGFWTMRKKLGETVGSQEEERFQ